MKAGFKSEILETEAAPKQVKKRFHSPVDMEEVEIKKLNSSDAEEAARVMRKCIFTVTDEEVLDIIRRGMSYGAFVDRILVGVGLAWGVSFNPETREFEEAKENALFLEDDAILLAYEGRGIRELLIEKREEEGKAQGFTCAVAITSQFNPEDANVGEVVRQRGNKTEKALLKRGYRFAKTQNGVIAYKEL
jgi:GNAT superfamily N-acetyltransferase